MSLAIEARVQEILARIARAAERAGRGPDQVTLIAVTKTFGPEDVASAYRAGIRIAGENRVQEAVGKMDAVASLLAPGEPLYWHMIGHVQSRQARVVAERFDMVHSVDSVELAAKLDRHRKGRLPILLEMNLAAEPQKFGFHPTPRVAFFQQVEAVLQLPRLQVQGLMMIGPQTDNPAGSVPFFRQLRELRDELQSQFPAASWHHLSMGMTADFEVAIAEGATMVRVGRAIFGARD